MTRLLQEIPVTRDKFAALKTAGYYLEECIARKIFHKDQEAESFLDSAIARGVRVLKIMEMAKYLVENGWLRDDQLDRIADKVQVPEDDREPDAVVVEQDDDADLLHNMPP